VADNVEAITKNKEDKPKVKKADHFRNMALFMSGGMTQLFTGEVPSYPHNYYVEMTAEKNIRLLLDNGNRTVQHCDADHFKSSLVRFCSRHLKKNPFWSNVTDSVADQYYKFWRLFTPVVKSPIILGLKDYDGLCFTRSDIVYDTYFEPADYAVFDKLLGKNHNYLAVKHFLGSLFDPDADIQQTLVLYGEGMNGKSTLLNFLCRCLGDAVASSMAPSRFEMKNFTAQFVNKRLGLFPDAESLGFMQSQHFKMMTGGDLVAIDEKYEKVYNKRLNCKFIISSNNKPELKGQKSDSRRIIYYEMPEVDKPDPKFIERLYENRHGIFKHLMDLYYQDIGSNTQIPVEDNQLDNILDENSSDEASFFDKYFVSGIGTITSLVALNNCIIDHFGATYPAHKFKKNFDIWVRRELEIGGKTVVTFNGKNFRAYKGFQLANSYGKLGDGRGTTEHFTNIDEEIEYYKNRIKALKEEKTKDACNVVTPEIEIPF
jgi:hypothetical protein